MAVNGLISSRKRQTEPQYRVAGQDVGETTERVEDKVVVGRKVRMVIAGSHAEATAAETIPAPATATATAATATAAEEERATIAAEAAADAEVRTV